MRAHSLLLFLSLGGAVACGSSGDSEDGTTTPPGSTGGQAGSGGKAGSGGGVSGSSGQSGSAGSGNAGGSSGAAGQGGTSAQGGAGQGGAGQGGAGSGGTAGATAGVGGEGGQSGAGSGEGGGGSSAGQENGGEAGLSGSSGQAGSDAGSGGADAGSGGGGEAGQGGSDAGAGGDGGSAGSGGSDAGSGGSDAGAGGSDAGSGGAGGAPCETLCGGQCVDLQTDNQHCGACEIACAAGSSCKLAKCECDAGLSLCGGACVDLQSNQDHCGQCQLPCAQGANCEAGICVCPGGGEACNGQCHDTKTDPNFCGNCSTQCLPGHACVQGVCQCPAGLQECNLVCVELATDTQNCGGCEVVCPVGGVCDTGACKCPSGTAECVAGQCLDTQGNNAHCGACGVLCEGTSACVNGVCSCPLGQSYCGGDCVDAPDCSLFVAQVSPDHGWQSGGNYITIQGGGFTAGTKVFLGTGRAPALVLDSKTLRIQTPPGPLGLHDVRVELPGGKTSTKKNGFRYDTGGLNPVWEQKKMQIIRGEDPGVAVLQDGRAIIAGGTKVADSLPNCLNTAELYNRSIDQVTQAKNTMSTPRWQNSAVTLLDGRVLMVGGACSSTLGGCNGDPKKADLFDPATDTFSPTGNLNIGRSYTRAVLLPDGRVLVGSANNSSLEVYDPATGTFKLISHSISHVFGFMVRLRDGRVMFGSGDNGNKAVEFFDPDTDTISGAAPVNLGRSKLTAHTLPDGRVMLIGGASSSAGGISNPMDSIETYNPQTGSFTLQPYKLQKGRCWHASSLVRDGTVLVMGGYVLPGQCSSLDDSVDQIDPVNGTSGPAPFFNQNGQKLLPNKNCEWSATTLLDGSVLAVGGGACGTGTALPDIDFLGGSF